jgi:hypothetical protein
VVRAKKGRFVTKWDEAALTGDGMGKSSDKSDERRRRTTSILACAERPVAPTSLTVHPGWVRATEILLKGLRRLRELEEADASIREPDRRGPP